MPRSKDERAGSRMDRFSISQPLPSAFRIASAVHAGRDEDFIAGDCIDHAIRKPPEKHAARNIGHERICEWIALYRGKSRIHRAEEFVS